MRELPITLVTVRVSVTRVPEGVTAMGAFVALVATLGYTATWRVPPAPRPAVAMNLLEEAADGNIAAALEAGAIAAAAAFGAGAAFSLVQSEQGEMEREEERRGPPESSRAELIPVNVDLGPEGQPSGVSRLLFKRLLPRSELLQLELPVPLGLLIEERESDGAIVITGALPGFSAINQVEVGDLLRAVTAYVMVA